jgi:hypothetical protein
LVLKTKKLKSYLLLREAKEGGKSGALLRRHITVFVELVFEDVDLELSECGFFR